MDKSDSELDVETELFRILQEEIWKEITAESGLTQEMLDAQIVANLRKISEENERNKGG
jgi:hypothetical protein